MSKPDNYMAVLKHAVAIMNEEHLEDSTCIDESYSGCGMYGKTVSAIVSSLNPMIIGTAIARALIAKTNDINSVEYVENYLPQRTDSMGYHKVFY